MLDVIVCVFCNDHISEKQPQSEKKKLYFLRSYNDKTKLHRHVLQSHTFSYLPIHVHNSFSGCGPMLKFYLVDSIT